MTQLMSDFVLQLPVVDRTVGPTRPSQLKLDMEPSPGADVLSRSVADDPMLLFLAGEGAHLR